MRTVVTSVYELFPSCKSGEISELIAQKIKNIILNGTMKPEDKLPLKEN